MADVVIPAMSTVGDIISLLENSSLEWEYEYNPDQLVLYLEPGERIDVYYKRDGNVYNQIQQLYGRWIYYFS